MHRYRYAPHSHTHTDTPWRACQLSGVCWTRTSCQIECQIECWRRCPIVSIFQIRCEIDVLQWEWHKVKFFSQNSVATLGVLTIRVKAWSSFEVVSYVCVVFDAQTLLHLPFLTEEWTIRWPLQHKSSLIFRFWRKSRTKRWLGDLSRNPLVTLGLPDRSLRGVVQILRSLAQHSRHFGPLRSLSWWRGAMRSLPQPSRHFEFEPLRSLSLWRGANSAFARATLLPLWASQIALVVARCEFIEFCHRSRNTLVTLGLSDRSRGGAVQCDRSRNLLVTLNLGLWDRSRCGAVRILRSLAQHSCHFGPLRSLSWWRGANLSNFAIARATLSSLWACQIASLWRGAQLSWHFGRARSLSLRHCADFAIYLSRRSCATETSYKDLVHRPLIEILYCLLQRSCKEVSSRTEILPRELFWRASTEIS